MSQTAITMEPDLQILPHYPCPCDLASDHTFSIVQLISGGVNWTARRTDTVW